MSLKEFIVKLGYNTLDLWRKIFFIIMFGTSLILNMLLYPRIVLLYNQAKIPLQPINSYISFIAIGSLLVLAFVPLKKNASALFISFVTFLLLGLVLSFVSMFSIISSIYLLTTTL